MPREGVDVTAEWKDETVTVTIADDGPGFPPEIRERIGEPYVTSQRARRLRGELPGLGLGFFIAKTLLERTGARLTLENRTYPQRGAVIRLRWNRAEFERRGRRDILTAPQAGRFGLGLRQGSYRCRPGWTRPR